MPLAVAISLAVIWRLIYDAWYSVLFIVYRKLKYEPMQGLAAAAEM